MTKITLHEALIMIAGGPRETARVGLGRLIADQNALRQAVQACAGQLKDRRYRWLMRSFTLEHVKKRADEAVPTPRFWPPSEVLACIDKRRRSWPACGDQVRALAADLDSKWTNHDARLAVALEQLLNAARLGAVRLYYHDGGTGGSVEIPSPFLQCPVKTRPFENTVIALSPPDGPTHPTLSRSVPRCAFQNVHVDPRDVESIIINEARPPKPTFSVKPPVVQQPKEAAVRAWYRKYRSKNRSLRITRKEDISALNERFPTLIDTKGVVARLRSDPEFLVKPGRPNKKNLSLSFFRRHINHKNAVFQ